MDDVALEGCTGRAGHRLRILIMEWVVEEYGAQRRLRRSSQVGEKPGQRDCGQQHQLVLEVRSDKNLAVSIVFSSRRVPSTLEETIPLGD